MTRREIRVEEEAFAHRAALIEEQERKQAEDEKRRKFEEGAPQVGIEVQELQRIQPMQGEQQATITTRREIVVEEN